MDATVADILQCIFPQLLAFLLWRLKNQPLGGNSSLKTLNIDIITSDSVVKIWWYQWVVALGVPPNGEQKLISQNQEVNINATGPWPLDGLHLQYINITFYMEWRQYLFSCKDITTDSINSLAATCRTYNKYPWINTYRCSQPNPSCLWLQVPKWCSS